MGGWTTIKTQKTILTPSLVKETISYIKRFETEFNNYFKSNLIFSKPLGSSYYYLNDLKENKNNIYGDIDYLVLFPSFKSMPEYREKIKIFIDSENPEYLDKESNGNVLIFKFNNNYIQVDLLGTIPSLEKWNEMRFVPERGIKGFVIGNLYSVLNKLYNININDKGVTLKMKNNRIVSHRVRKDTETIHISNDPEYFWRDLLIWFRKHFNIHPLIIFTDNIFYDNQGMNPDDIKIEKLINGIKGFAKALETNDLLNNNIFPYKNYKDMLNHIKEEYIKALDEQLLSTQYHNKSRNENAEKNYNKIIKDVQKGKMIINKLI